jgi:hypothetical protein
VPCICNYVAKAQVKPTKDIKLRYRRFYFLVFAVKFFNILHLVPFFFSVGPVRI